MLRILHVVTHLNRGGLETMIMNYYRIIDREKIQFDFLVQGDEEGAYEEEIRNMGGKIFRINRIKFYAPWIFENDIYEFLKNHQEYNIIHSHLNGTSKYVLRAAKRANVPNRISHSHTVLKNNNLKNIYKNLTKVGINKYATNRFACSEDAGKWLYGKQDFEILSNAIDIEKFKYNEDIREKYRKEFDFKEDEVVYYNVGRFVEQKNQMFLIDIFYEIQKKQNSKLVLIGDGKLKQKLIEKTKKLGIENKVFFTGVRSDISDIVNAMDVFLFPSISEGLGIVLIEAQSNGLKCFISDAIPKEAKILDNVEVISLKEDSAQWADKILKSNDLKRIQNISKIKEVGYDIKEESEKLQKYYLKLYSKN